MICEECKKSGVTSTVTTGVGSTTAMHWSPHYDEAGRAHRHDQNTHTSSFRCSNGHSWTARGKRQCWCGWPDGEGEAVSDGPDFPMCPECPDAQVRGIQCPCGMPIASDWQIRERRAHVEHVAFVTIASLERRTHAEREFIFARVADRWCLRCGKAHEPGNRCGCGDVKF